MKIAITINLNSIDKNNIFANGHSFNVLLWYDMFKKCGYDVIFLYEGEHPEKNKEKYEFIYIHDFLSNIKKYNINVFISLGFTMNENHYKLIKNNNIKTIHISLGSQYYNDCLYLRNDKYKNTITTKNIYDEIWISPHFKYSIEYFKVRNKTDNIYVCPYIWREDLIKDYKDKILELDKKIKIGICEANIVQNKNCLIPFAICEKGNHLIEQCNIFCIPDINNHVFMKEYVLNSELQKNKKITVSGRCPITQILSEHCNCILSFVENWDLNYIYLECFYLGVPVIHNSPMLKDFGYYYPDFDINKGVEQIEKVIKNHNKEKYIKKHKEILDKYSMNNPMAIAWIKGRLNEDINYHFE